MTDQLEGQRRRRRRDTIEEVFDEIVERMAVECERTDSQQSEWGDAHSIRSQSDAGPRELIGQEISSEIGNSFYWTDALVECLAYVNNQSDPKGKVSAQRTRLRRLLNALNHFMGRHPELQGLAVRDDVAILGLALDGLNSGTVHPLVATQSFNKPQDTKVDQQFRAYVVSFVHILILAGVKEPAAFRVVASELTRAGYKASRPGEKNPSTDFRAETVRRWHHRAQPAVEHRAAMKNPPEDRSALLGQHDSQVVFNMLDGFVANATNVDGEKMPPTETYAMKVIRATLQHPTTRGLFARRL